MDGINRETCECKGRKKREIKSMLNCNNILWKHELHCNSLYFLDNMGILIK
jgi:hypothetical protein